MDNFIENARNMRMIPSSSGEYQVYEGQAKLCIDLEKKQCFYGEWIMSGISYKHVVYYVHNKRIKLEDVFHMYYTIETFRNIYFEVMYPLQEVDMDCKEGDIIVLLLNLKKKWGQTEEEYKKGKGRRLTWFYNEKGFYI
jgi:hypothetical protein